MLLNKQCHAIGNVKWNCCLLCCLSGLKEELGYFRLILKLQLKTLFRLYETMWMKLRMWEAKNDNYKDITSTPANDIVCKRILICCFKFSSSL